MLRFAPLLLCFALFAQTPESPQAKPIASYDITAVLDAKTHTVTGHETVTWVNDSNDSVPTLQFHLYINAFRNSRSTFFKESGGQLRGDRFKGDDWGWIRVNSMRLEEGPDLTSAIKFIAPDDGNTEDRTVIEVPLPQSVRPGQTIKINIDFTTKLPMIFARTGFHGDFHLVGQWFPKLGVWETAGFRYSTRGAWNCHQFHANSEFFANFGDYRVELTVPSRYVVGATGEQVRRLDNAANQTSTYTFEQRSVTDFAWTAQPGFLRVERLFTADKETSVADLSEAARIHGLPAGDIRLSDVKMIALVQPEHREQIERHFNGLRAGLKWFGLYYGHYPYKTITVVDPPYGAGGAGGMEYPTFITAGTSYHLPPDALTLEMVTVHEFGHQFWMELVASNEFEESWLDEGFNTYSTGRIMDKVFGPSTMPIQVFGLNLWTFFDLPRVTQASLDRAAHVSTPRRDDLVRRAWEYYDGNSYGMNSYSRTGVTLRTLEGILGRDTMDRVMRTYYQRWRFRHPTSRDFQAVVNQVSGRNMDWFFDEFIFGSRVLDYAVASVESVRQRTPIGFFDKGSALSMVSRKDAEARDKKLDEDKSFKPDYQSTVKIARLGDAVVPVEIEIRFTDGHVERREWDGAYRWAKFTFLRKAEVESVQIDPRRKLPLDISYANNSWKKDYNAPLSAHWGSNVLFWIQNLLLTLSSIA